jgi:hypothetical protein
MSGLTAIFRTASGYALASLEDYAPWPEDALAILVAVEGRVLAIYMADLAIPSPRPWLHLQCHDGFALDWCVPRSTIPVERAP